MIARIARLSLLLLLAAVALQLATVAAVAAIGAQTKPSQPEVSSAALLIDGLRLAEQYDVPDTSIDWEGLFRRCGIEPGALGVPTADLASQPNWQPEIARSLLSVQLRATVDRAERGALERNLERSTSEFARRFLIGCMSGTVFAPVCRTRAESLLEVASRQPLPLEVEERFAWLSDWNSKTMCVFMRGAARELAEERK